MPDAQKYISLFLIVQIVIQLSPLLAQSVGDQCDFEILPPDLPITLSQLGANWTVTAVYFQLFGFTYLAYDEIPQNFWADGDVFEIGYTFDNVTYNDNVFVQFDGQLSISSATRECFSLKEDIRIFTSSSFSFKYTPNPSSCKPRTVAGFYVAGSCDVTISLDQNSEPNTISFPLPVGNSGIVVYPCNTTCRFNFELVDSSANFIGFILLQCNLVNGSDIVSITDLDTGKAIEFSGYYVSSDIDLGTFGTNVEFKFTGSKLEYHQSYVQISYNLRPIASDGDCDSSSSDEFYCRRYTDIVKGQSPTKATVQTASNKYMLATQANLSATIFDIQSFTCTAGSCFNGGRASLDSSNDSVCICDIGFTGRFCEYKISSSENDSIGFTYVNSDSCGITDSLTSESNAMVIRSVGTVENVSVSYLLPNGSLSIDNYIAVHSVYFVDEATVPTMFESSIGPLPTCNVSTVYTFEMNGYSTDTSTRDNKFVTKVNFTCMSPPETTETSTSQTLTTTTTTTTTPTTSSSPKSTSTPSSATTTSPTTTTLTSSATTTTSTATTAATQVPTTTFANNDNTDLGRLKANITMDNVEHVLLKLVKTLTQIGGNLSELNVTDSTEVLSAAANISGISAQSGVPFDKSIDLLLDNGSDKFSSESSNNLLTAIKLYGQNVNLTIGQSSNNSGNSFVHVVNFVDCRQPQFQVGLVDIERGDNHTANSVLNTEWHSHQSGSHTDTLALITITPGVVCANASGATRLSFQLFRASTTAFVPISTNEAVVDDTYCRMCRFPGSSVISGTVVDRVGDDVDIPMSAQIELRKHLDATQEKFDRNFLQSCGYWLSSGWVTDDNNISLVSISGDNYKFNSTHLTDFSLIGSNNPKDKIFCQSGLSVLGTVGCILSVVSLVILTFFLLTIRWKRYQHQLEKVFGKKLATPNVAYFSHLFIGVLAVFFFLFALFSDQTAVAIDDSVCSAFAAVNYFLLLSTMFLTCGQAVLVFQQFFKVVNNGKSEEEKEETFDDFKLWALVAVVSAVLPAIIVITLSQTAGSFLVRSDFFCWINPAYANLAVVIPIATMLAFTIGLTAIGQIIQTRSNKSKMSGRHKSFQRAVADMKKKIIKLFGLQVILGLPWIFLFLTEIPNTTAFHYIFTITNAFQGVWILVVYLLIEHRKDAQMMWKLISHKLRLKSVNSVSNMIAHESERQTKSDIVVPPKGD